MTHHKLVLELQLHTVDFFFLERWWNLHFHSLPDQFASLTIAVKGVWSASEGEGGWRGEEGRWGGGSLMSPSHTHCREDEVWYEEEGGGVHFKKWSHRVLLVGHYQTSKDKTSFLLEWKKEFEKIIGSSTNSLFIPVIQLLQSRKSFMPLKKSHNFVFLALFYLFRLPQWSIVCGGVILGCSLECPSSGLS